MYKQLLHDDAATRTLWSSGRPSTVRDAQQHGEADERKCCGKDDFTPRLPKKTVKNRILEENNKSQTEFWKKKASEVREESHNFANGSDGKCTPNLSSMHA